MADAGRGAFVPARPADSPTGLPPAGHIRRSDSCGLEAEWSAVVQYLAEQEADNRSTAGFWDTYSSHRNALSQLVMAAPPSVPCSLGVFGAGNCNDLALNELAGVFSTIRLVDIDQTAIVEGLSRQFVAQGDMQSIVVERRDFTGALDIVQDWLSDGASREYSVVQEIVRRLDASTGALEPPCDVILVTPTLSQVIGCVARILDSRDDSAFVILERLREAYLRAFVYSIAPGGRGILAVDVVSNATARLDIDHPSDADIILAKLLRAGNFFTGCNPYRVVDVLRAAFVGELANVHTTSPWVWQMTEHRQYLVQAVMVTRKPETAWPAPAH